MSLRADFASRVILSMWLFTLRAIDPFNSSRDRFTTTDPRFYQVTDRRRAIRGLVLAVNWNFGKPLKKRGHDESDQGGGDQGGT